MRALLLAAGFGKRLQPVTDLIPKCLVPIAGKPLIDYWFEQLFEAGIERVLVNTHYLSERVVAYIEKSPYKKRVDIVYEPVLLNTGGTLLQNRSYFKHEPLLMAHADNLCLCDFGAFIKAHQNRRPHIEITMMTFKTDQPESCGIVELDSQNTVIAFYEKKENVSSFLANAAVYIIESSVVDKLESFKKQEIDFSIEVIPKYLGRIQVHHNDVYHRDIGTLQSYALAQIELLGLKPTTHSKRQFDVSFFVPCYNEEKNLLATIETIHQAVHAKSLLTEVLICDDGSTDKTIEIAESAVLKYPQLNIKVLKNKKNRGLGFNYFRCAFVSRANHYMLINGDNVEPKEAIEAIINNINKADIVIPHFGNKDKRTKFRRNVSKLFSFLVNRLSGHNIKYYNGPVLHKTENVKFWRSETVGYGYQAELICRLLHEGMGYVEVEIQNSDRQWGTSKAFSLSNLFSVTNSLFHILWRRFEYNVFGLLSPGINRVEEVSEKSA